MFQKFSNPPTEGMMGEGVYSGGGVRLSSGCSSPGATASTFGAEASALASVFRGKGLSYAGACNQ